MMKTLAQKVKMFTLFLLCTVFAISISVAMTSFDFVARADGDATERAFDEDFESFDVDTAMVSGSPYTIAGTVNVKADPKNGSNKVGEITAGSLIQHTTSGLASVDVVISIDFYIPEGTTPNYNMQIRGSTNNWSLPFRIVSGVIQVDTTKKTTVADCPTGEWFTLILTIKNYSSADLHMVKGGNNSLLAENFLPIEAAHQASYANGLQLVRFGSNIATTYVDNLIVEKAPEKEPELITVFDENFEGLETGSAMVSGSPYTIVGTINAKADPKNANNKVGEITQGGMIQHGPFSSLAGEDIYVSADLYLPEGTPNFYVQLRGSVNTFSNPFRTAGGVLQVNQNRTTVGSYPVGEWFTLVLKVKGYSTGTLYMIKDGRTSILASNFTAISDPANYTGGLQYVRFGNNSGTLIVDNLKITNVLESIPFEEDFEDRAEGALTNGVPYTVANADVTVVKDPTDETNKGVYIDNGGLIQLAGFDYLAGTDMVISTDFYIEEGTTPHYNPQFINVSSYVQPPYRIYKGNIEVYSGNEWDYITAAEAPVGEKFTLVMVMRDYSSADLYMTVGGETKLLYGGFTPIAEGGQASYRANGVTILRFGTNTVDSDEGIFIDNISVKRALNTDLVKNVKVVRKDGSEDLTFTYDGMQKELEIQGVDTQKLEVVGIYDSNLLNAGTHWVVSALKVKNVSNLYSDVLYLNTKVVIQKAEYTLQGITFDDVAYFYDANEVRTISISGALPADVTVTYMYNGEEFTGATEEGEYEITALFATTRENYNAPASMTATLTINRKPSYDMNGVSFEDKTVTYDGNAHDIAISGNLPDGVTVKYYLNGEEFVAQTNAGEYTVVAKFDGDEVNYNPIADMQAKLIIEPKAIDMSGVTFENKNVTYDETAHDIAISGNLPDGVTVKYYLEGEEFVALTNAGEYTITAKFTVPANHKAIDDMTAVLTIEKATIDMSGVTFENKTVSYNEDEQTIAVGGTLPDGVTVKYYSNEEEFVGATNVGEYTIIAKFEASSNYNAIADMSAKLVIEKADVDMSGITFADKTVDYNTLAQTIVVEGDLPSFITVVYKCEGATFTGAIEPGVYEVTAEFATTNSNYNVPATMTATLTIVQNVYDMSTISFENATFVYDGEAKSIVIRGELPEGVTVTYENNGQINAGEYTITAKFEGDESYAPIDDMVATITITKATYDMSGISFKDVTVEYDGKAHEIKISGNLPEGVIVVYEGNGKVEVGKYTVTVKFTGDAENYNAIADMTATLTITEKETSSVGCMSSVGSSIGLFGLLAVMGTIGFVFKKKND